MNGLKVGLVAALMALAVGSTAQAQSLTPQQEAAIRQILTEHQQNAAPLRQAIQASTVSFLNDISGVVAPPQAPRFAAFVTAFGVASTRATAIFNGLPEPGQTPQNAASLMAAHVNPHLASLLTDLGVPGPVAATVAQRANLYYGQVGTLLAHLAALRRITNARIAAVIGATP